MTDYATDHVYDSNPYHASEPDHDDGYDPDVNF